MIAKECVKQHVRQRAEGDHQENQTKPHLVTSEVAYMRFCVNPSKNNKSYEKD